MPRAGLGILVGLAVAVGGCSDPNTMGPPGDAAADALGPDGGVDGATPDGGDAAADGGVADGGPGPDGALDGSVADGGVRDGGPVDGSAFDSAPLDGGGPADTGAADTGVADTGVADTGVVDSGVPDTGTVDSGAPDTGVPPTGGCMSGATGTHVLRFRWEGTSSGSTAYVVYEANSLPDTSRWRVTAASSSIGYRPVFQDTFLGEGGLALSGTVFIDVELSTLGLSPVANATIAVYGRSYNTTSSGSFSWQTFSGTGSSPRGGVANSAPYQWYGADAASALPAGDDGTLLRIRAGGPSNALIVRRVEVCFNAP